MEKQKVQVSVDKERERRIDKETKKRREEKEEAFHLFSGGRRSAHTAVHIGDFASLPLRHITIEFRSRRKHCHIKQERMREEKKNSHKTCGWKLEGRKKTKKDNQNGKRRKFKSA